MGQMQKIGKHRTTVKKDAVGNTDVTYRNTIVVSFNRGIIRLDSGGWLTATTKARMNQASRQYGLGYTVWQSDFKWYVGTKTSVVYFYDGIRIDRESGAIL